MSEILLGYEIGTGKPVKIPVRHLCVTGQTQEAGKTTALEALISRSGLRAIAFITKRGEKSFENGRKILPYFRERVDWEFVESIIEAIMRQKMKFERAWIVRATKGARSLADVRRNVTEAMGKAKRSMDADIYMLLGEYLDKVLPLIARLPKTEAIKLERGLNVMDLRSYPEELQMLVVSSSFRWIHEHEADVISILPEAWKFAPQGRKTPVSLEVRKLAREGAGLKNYLWIDSQDIAGVEKEILRAAAVWLIGVQREGNEVERALKSIPKGIKRPKEGDIPTLQLGQFFACWGEHVKKTYVQPSWMLPNTAFQIAMGDFGVDQVRAPERRESEDENLDYKLAYEEAQQTIKRLEERIAALENKPKTVTPVTSQHIIASRPASALMDEPPAMALTQRVPMIDLTVRKYSIECDDSTLNEIFHVFLSAPHKGLALLLSEGFFDSGKTGNSAFEECKRRGFPTAKPNVYKELDKLAALGFLTKGEGGYTTVPGMKVNVRELEATA